MGMKTISSRAFYVPPCVLTNEWRSPYVMHNAQPWKAVKLKIWRSVVLTRWCLKRPERALYTFPQDSQITEVSVFALLLDEAGGFDL